MSEKNLHEVVIPTDPLNVWYFVFHDNKIPFYIAPHWHRGIELSYTIRGNIDNFQISGKKYNTKPGKIFIVNSQEIHSIRNCSGEQDLALSIIFPYSVVCRLYPQISEEIIAINDPTSFTDLQTRGAS